MTRAGKIQGVSEDVADEEIKAAYRRPTKKFHPDVNHEPGSYDGSLTGCIIFLIDNFILNHPSASNWGSAPIQK